MSEKWKSDWYAVQVLTGHEDEVIEACRPLVRKELKEEIFTLKREKEMHRAGHYWTELKALFPGYIFFVTPDVTGLYEALRVITLFKKLVRAGREIQPLYAKEAALFAELGGEKHIVEMSIGFKEGDEVGVLCGPLAVYKGKIVRIDRHNRTARIETTFFGETKLISVGLKVLRTRTEAENIMYKTGQFSLPVA